ncbi:hypothetical protein AXF42_Ash000624 [Apostasia shenzhenica]|uniref:Uncharacterized protein n=1 Tax=Apostasia shenzhenica TaxID=1088818 RepID=A0A2I0AGU5_9ASPA|nr:hypothetical protein AXF42_Ash000624 [Apostasia shenzhenica]
MHASRLAGGGMLPRDLQSDIWSVHVESNPSNQTNGQGERQIIPTKAKCVKTKSPQVEEFSSRKFVPVRTAREDAEWSPARH